MRGKILEQSLVWEMLSAYGRRVRFLSNGVLGQTAEARANAYTFNATLGEARENGAGMYLRTIQRKLGAFLPDEIYPYAPPGGLLPLRQTWREKGLRENPMLSAESIGLPVVCAGLTHGLFLIAALFLDDGDPVVLHDMHWENYDLIFNHCYGGHIYEYATFDNGEFNTAGLREQIMSCPGEKELVVLNFPNNPTGYMPTAVVAREIADILREAAEAGKKLVVLCDDAYYGFWYGRDILRESIFGMVSGIHPNILAVRLDGATKEYYAGGLRVGFITYGGQPPEVLTELERRTMGAIRISISSSSHIAQSLLLNCLSDPQVQAELQEKKAVLADRGRLAMERCRRGSQCGLWTAYPFRAGYFICLRTVVNAEELRQHLLLHYGMGVIALNEWDIRIALPCLEPAQINTLFDCLDRAIEEVQVNHRYGGHHG